nr:60S ribosomal protein L18A [Cryptomonas sp.]
MTWLKQYYIIGRPVPSEKIPEPGLLIMKVFAPNEIIGKSRFWYFLRKTQKIKKTGGELIEIKKISERKNKNVKNYGIWIRCELRSGISNMYKEYRDIFASGAVEQMYMEMAARHRVRWSSIVVLRVEELSSDECVRLHVKQFHSFDIKFPVIRNIYRENYMDKFSQFKAYRPRVSIKN